MAAYRQLTVSDLRELCDERQIDRRGLKKKPQLIAALCAWDDDNELTEEEEDDDGPDNELALDGAGSRAADDSGSVVGHPSLTDQVGGRDEPESVEILRLKLALAERQAQLDKERDERARLARERDWQIEQERMAMQAQTDPSASSANRPTNRAEIQHLLPRMNSDDDVLTFFHTFERAMNLNKVEKSFWPRFLPAQLNSKANKVLSSLTLTENENYDVCKQAVLEYFQLGPHTYLKAFRSLKRGPGESYKMFKNRLQDYLRYYIEAKHIEDLDSLADAMLAEQFIETLPQEVRQFVVSKQPSDAEQCSEFAELYCEVTKNANKSSQPPSNATQNETGHAPSQPKGNGGNKGHGNGRTNSGAGKKPVA